MSANGSSVAASVRAELARAGISARRLADHLTINRGQLHRRLNGEVSFRAEELVAIAAELGIPASTFLDESERAVAG